jgi:hypothetical protein
MKKSNLKKVAEYLGIREDEVQPGWIKLAKKEGII